MTSVTVRYQEGNTYPQEIVTGLRPSPPLSRAPLPKSGEGLLRGRHCGRVVTSHAHARIVPEADRPACARVVSLSAKIDCTAHPTILS
jgi:hypothetical protein